MASYVVKTYMYPQENCEVTFLPTDTSLSVIVDTPRLYMRSIAEEDLPFYTLLFSNDHVIEKFGLPGINASLYIKERIYDWKNRWEKKIPYSALTIFEKGTNATLGYVAAESAAPGTIEIGVAFMPLYWNQRFASEAVTALVKAYLPSTATEKYLIEGKPLKQITAIARSDNIASVKLLQKILHETPDPLCQENGFRFFKSH